MPARRLAKLAKAIIIKINAVDKIEENLIKSIKSVLEEKLKRRVEIIINVERSTKEKEQG